MSKKYYHYYNPSSKKLQWKWTERNDFQTLKIYIFIHNRTKKTCLIQKWDLLLFHEKYQLILNLMTATHTQRFGTRSCFLLCSTPSSFDSSLQTSGLWGDQLLVSWCYKVMWFVIDAVRGLTLSCWNMQGLPFKTCNVDESICCSKTCKNAFRHWLSLSRCANCQFHRHESTPKPSQMQHFELTTDEEPDGSSPL